MFFVQRGLVAVLDNDDNNVIKMLGPGQHFGEVSYHFNVQIVLTPSKMLQK